MRSNQLSYPAIVSRLRVQLFLELAKDSGIFFKKNRYPFFIIPANAW